MTGVHRVLPYDSEQMFLAASVPFIEDGLRAGDTIMAVATAANIELLRDALGTHAGSVMFAESTEWYEHPVRTLALRLGEIIANPTPVRLIGEEVWSGRDPMETLEWQRLEAIVNVALRRTDAWVMCPYDRRTVPPDVVTSAMRTHPQVVVPGPEARDNPSYVDPLAYIAALDRTPLQPPPDGHDSMPITSPDLHPLRAFLAERAARAGMKEESVHTMLLAVTEVATDALRHAASPVMATAWPESGRLVCQVTAQDSWVPSGGPGFIPPEPSSPPQLGMWAVRMLSDVVQVRIQPPRTTVRVYACR